MYYMGCVKITSLATLLSMRLCLQVVLRHVGDIAASRALQVGIRADPRGTRMDADRCVVMLFMTFVTRRGTRHGTCTSLEAQTVVPRGNVSVARRGRRFL